MSEFYIVTKLTSGEQVMAVLKEEDDNYVLVENPMVMKTTLDFDAGKERITASPLCPFSDDKVYVLAKRNLLYVKKLHHIFVNHYQQIVAEYAQSSNFVPEGSAEALDWEDEKPTPEEARKMINQLKNVFGTEEKEVNWEEKLKQLVPGNDTIN